MLFRPRGPGQPLPATIQRKVEALFRVDLSSVRVHVVPEAAAYGALALTQGSDIYFAPGHYQPESAHGERLLAHELTHVVQQRTGRARNPFGSGVALVQDPVLEAEAERMSHRFATFQVAPAPRLPDPPPASPWVLQPMKRKASGSGPPLKKKKVLQKRWISLSVDEIQAWLEGEIFDRYEPKLRAARQEMEQKLNTVSHPGRFQSMIESDTEHRAPTPSVELSGLGSILDYTARLEAYKAPAKLSFYGGEYEFSNYGVRRSETSELYVHTKPSKYVKQIGKLKDVEGDAEEQARTIRRLLKGYKLSTDEVVKDQHLERMAIIWGVSETYRNPATLGHLLILLHLVKKGEMSWQNTIKKSHPGHFAPSEGGASALLQQLRKAMIDKLVQGTQLPTKMMSFSAPYRKNLADFLVSAATAPKYNGFDIQLGTIAGTIKVWEVDRNAALSDVRLILRNKILDHFA